jgi:superfamily II DNA or RNA helicase
MFFTIDNEIKISYPTPEVLKSIKRDLTFANPDYVNRKRMGKWTGNVPREICLYREEGDDYVYVPFGYMYALQGFMRKDNCYSWLKFQPRVDYKCTIELRGYQEKAVTNMLRHPYGILQSRPASGKTIMGIAMIARRGRKALWLAHTKDLVDQAYTQAKKYLDKSLLTVSTEGRVKIGNGITFATVQTMANFAGLERYKNYFDIVIVDECHRVCTSATSVGMFYKVVNTLAAPYKYGLSATVHRADGMIGATFAILGNVTYEVPFEDIEHQVMPVSVEAIYTNVGYNDCFLDADGTMVYTKYITYLAENVHRNNIAASMLAYETHPTLVLTDRLSQSEALFKMIGREDARVITGKTKREVRQAALEDMREGRANILFASYNLAKEGLDIPRLSRLYMLTPHRDSAVIEQAIGRIARVHPDKTDAIAYDFVDNTIYAQKCFKRRLRIYRKIGCEIHT